MPHNPLHLPVRVKRLAAVGIALITAGVWWLAGFRNAAVSRESPNVFETMLPLGLVLLAAGVGCVIHVVHSEMRRMREVGLLDPILRSTGEKPWEMTAAIEWIGIDPDVHARQRRALWVHLVFLPVFAAGLALIACAPAGSRLQWFIGVVYVLLLVSIAIFVAWHTRVVLRAKSMRIGTNGVDLLLDVGNGRVTSVPLHSVRARGSQLLVGARILAIADPWRRPLFPLEPFRGHILARLPEQSFVGPGGMYAAALIRGNPVALANAAMILISIALIALVELQPGAVETAVERFGQWLQGQ